MIRRAKRKPRNSLTLRVVPEPPEGTVQTMVRTGEGSTTVLLTGSGGVDWVCGQCGVVVLADMDIRLLPRRVFQCVGCGALNVDPSWVT